MKNILGTMRLPKTHSKIKTWLKTANKLGINWIDTAWIYGHSTVEKRLGLALEELREEGIEFKIQTKIWTSHFKKTKSMFNKQLKALKIKKIDSILLHRPSWNLNNDIKAWKTLIKLQQNKKVEIIGLSNFDKDMIEILIKSTNVKPAINQIELSVSNFRHDRIAYAKEMNIEIQSWSSFGNNVKNNLKNELVLSLAKKYKVMPGTIISSFLSSQDIIPMHASFNKKHLKESIETIKLTKAEIKKLYELNIYDNKFGETYP